ncbi:MAG: CDP-archaeol synthase [Coprococcus sp.]
MSVLTMYVTMSSVIFGGIANMLFCKTAFYKRHNAPIDFGKTYKNKRIFGENKTWIGFGGMILFCIIGQLLSGFLCQEFSLENQLYDHHTNTVGWNLALGAVFGFIYMLFELPNSFIKRRLEIKPGETTNLFFFVFDQIDSLIGVMLVLFFTSDITFVGYLCYVGLGGLTHILVNLLLYKLRVRKHL